MESNCLVDRREQLRALPRELRQPRAAHLEARVAQALVLAVQRQVPGKLVQQQPDDEAHVDRHVKLGYSERRSLRARAQTGSPIRPYAGV